MISAIDVSNPIRLFFDTGINALGADIFWTIFWGMIALIILMGTVKSNIPNSTSYGLAIYFLVVAAACGTVLAIYAMLIFGLGAGICIAAIILKNLVD